MLKGVKKSETLLLIDGHSMAFRAFYALPKENFSTTGGQHTNAVYGFLSMLSNIVKDIEPTHMAVAFDVGRKTFRTDMFPEYKAQRDATPEEFKGQVPLIKEMLQALGIQTLEKEDYEADDIIATLVTKARGTYDIKVVTGDRDYFQLVDKDTTVLFPKQGVSKLEHFTPEAVKEKYGLTPAQYPDYAALRGDPSDNLPSIPRVGQKTAEKWIVKYGSLEGLIEHADEITGQAGENLRERIDQVLMNRDLTAMVTNLDFGLDDVQREDPDVDEVSAKFDELQFGDTLRQRVLASFGVKVEPKPAVDVALKNIGIKWLEKYGQEGTALALREQEVALVAGQVATTFKLDELEPAEDKKFSTWLAQAPKYVHGAKALWHEFRELGYELGGVVHDTELAAYLLRPGQRAYGLADVFQRHMQRQLAENLVEEAAAIAELAPELVSQLQDIEAYELYSDLELPLAFILARMEAAGIAVDLDKLTTLRDSFAEKSEAEVVAAREQAGDPKLNLASPKQLQVVLFETLGLPKTKKTKTGYSTAAKEIEQLAVNNPHPFLDHLLAYREYQKMKTTLDGLVKAGESGRIHTTFNQTVASTGRLSSTEPNMQNIPVRTETGRDVRSAFIVSEDYECLLTADYSQIEMRVMAHLSQDPGLIEAYIAGEDLHNYVGSKVFDVPIDGVTPELRRRVKAMSYGLVYGLSAYGLAQQLSIAPAEAKKIMESYFERFGGVQRYLAEVVEKARKLGYTETLFGRRRYLPELNSTNRVARENAERAALNAPIQGTAADIIKVAMIRVDRCLKGKKSRVLLQVHDELVVEVAPGELDEVKALIEREMDAAIELSVPLEVSAGVGNNWDEAAH